MLPEEHIPKFHHWLFSFLCKDELYNELAGDLEETFAENYQFLGPDQARSIYKKEVLKMLRPSVIRKFKVLPKFTPLDMFKNYFKISIRSLWRDKEHSLVSIFGLAAGVVASVLIFQYTNFENSYDSFHDESTGEIYRIGRITSDIATGDIISHNVANFHAFHPAVVEDVPEVGFSTHLLPANGVFTYQDVGHNIPDGSFTTGSFFDVFSFELLQGNAEDLNQPGTVFLSKTMANRIFGQNDPMGELIRYNDNFSNVVIELQVKGIFEDTPDNSHLKTNALMPMPNLISFADNGWFGSLRISDVTWRWIGFHTYIRVLPETDRPLLEEKLTEFTRKYRAPYDASQGRQQIAVVHNLSEIHFAQGFNAQLEPSADPRTVNMFTYIGILIVLIAWINFINLASARAVKRAKEVGIRKALGAFKKQLIQQFLLETFLVNFLALLLASGMILLIIPSFEEFVGAPVFEYFWDFSPFWTTYLLVFGVGALLSGLYPALALTRFQPIKVLRGNFSHSTQGVWLRKSLVFLQFGIVLIMLTGILGIRSQIRFMMNHDIGMNIDQTLIINAPPPFLRDSTYTSKLDTYRDDLLQIPAISGSTISSTVPGVRNDFGQTIFRTDRPSNESIFLYRSNIDPHFLSFFDLELIAGRAFSESLKGDRNVIYINEQALQELGFSSPEDAIGKRLTYPAGPHPQIVGVVKNFHQMGMNYAVDPLAMELDTAALGTYINIRMQTQNIPETLKTLEERYNSFFPGAPFDTFFLDQTFNDLYESDKKFNSVLEFFAIVAIFISSLGIFGLSSFLINSKLKEVSIRKVLGAGIREILKVLTKEYVLLVSLATLVSIPVAYLLIKQWLDNFLVSVTINPLIYVIPVFGLVLILCITIGGKTWKAVRVNPSRTLKAE